MTKQQTINKCIAYLKANYEFLISLSERQNEQLKQMITCELCGFSFDNRSNHECDSEVLADRVKQEEQYKEQHKLVVEQGEIKF